MRSWRFVIVDDVGSSSFLPDLSLEHKGENDYMLGISKDLNGKIHSLEYFPIHRVR